ncbi:MAG: hypothetical protein JJU11_12955 [Candidatus Sumerlaeia bacterium]|nr:hypothetical protein [Candidatus Sumerlaeia bacterium]
MHPGQLGLFLLILVAAMVFFHGGALWGSMVFSGGDLVNYFIPLRDSQIREGWFAGWMPETFSGRPIGDDPQTGLFYPPHWLHAIGIAPERITTCLVLLHYLGSAAGLYIFLRLKFDHLPAVLAGLVWTFCGYQILRLDNGVIPFVYAQAWVPWMLLAAERQRLDTPCGRRWLALLGIFGALQLSIGAVQICQITWFGLLVWTLGRFHRQNVRGCLYLGGGFVAAGLLAVLANAPMLAGALRLQGEAFPRVGDDPWSFLSDGSLAPRVLLTWIIPEIFSPGNEEGLYWGSQVGYAETNSFMGVVPLMLSLFALAWMVSGWFRKGEEAEGGLQDRELSRWGISLLVAAVIGILIALGSHGFLFRPLTEYVPTFDMFRVPARWSLWFAMGVAILSAWGLQVLLKSATGVVEKRHVQVPWFAAMAVFLVIIAILRIFVYTILEGFGQRDFLQSLMRHNPREVDKYMEFPGRAAQWALIMAISGAIFGSLLVVRKLPPVLLASLLVVVATADLLRFWSPFKPPIPTDISRFEILSEGRYHRIPAGEFRNHFYPDSEFVQDLRSLPGGGRLHYFDTLMAFTHDQLNREMLFERPATHGDLYVTRGYSQLHLAGYVHDYYQSLEPLPGGRPGAFMSSGRLLNRNFLDAYNVTHVLTYEHSFFEDNLGQVGMDAPQVVDLGVHAWVNPTPRGWAWVSTSGDILTAIPEPGAGEVDLTRRDATHWEGTVVLQSPAYLHLSSPDYTGWSLVATHTDGARITADGSRSVYLDRSGEWSFQRRFRPGGLQPVPLLLSVVTFGAMFGLLVFGGRIPGGTKKGSPQEH